MKLRNKKTGETGYLELEKGDDEKYTGLRVYKNDFMYKRYDSLAGVLEEWEDYKPAEPLIKDEDEKARKAVRAFSEVIQEKKHILVIKLYERGIAEFSNGSCFWMRLPVSSETMNALEDRTYYTITELCGEEEE